MVIFSEIAEQENLIYAILRGYLSNRWPVVQLFGLEISSLAHGQGHGLSCCPQWHLKSRPMPRYNIRCHCAQCAQQLIKYAQWFSYLLIISRSAKPQKWQSKSNKKWPFNTAWKLAVFMRLLNQPLKNSRVIALTDQLFTWALSLKALHAKHPSWRSVHSDQPGW